MNSSSLSPPQFLLRRQFRKSKSNQLLRLLVKRQHNNLRKKRRQPLNSSKRRQTNGRPKKKSICREWMKMAMLSRMTRHEKLHKILKMLKKNLSRSHSLSWGPRNARSTQMMSRSSMQCAGVFPRLRDSSSALSSDILVFAKT